MPYRSPVIEASDIIEERIGLAARTQFNADLTTLLREFGERDIHAYLERLRNTRETSEEWQALIRALTIGETYFRREETHFNLLRNHVLPQIIEKRRASGDLHLNIWSVGCASGEEPYSLAITLYETLPDLSDWTIRLIGTDLNESSLKAARHGIYRKWAFRHTDIDFQNLYFDPANDGLQIKPHIREMVTFRASNVLKGAPLPQCDILMCRNVLLYFSHKAAGQAESIFYNALMPGGWLLLGQAEAIRDKRAQWLTHLFPGAPVYQKPSEKLKLKPGEFAVKQHDKLATQPIKKVQLENASLDGAMTAIKEEQYDEAERLLVSLIGAHPANPEFHVMLGYVYANRHEHAEAFAQIDTALSINPLTADAHYLQAMLHMEEGRMDDAEKALKATLYCQRNHPLASFVIGNLYAQSGLFINAQRHWENAKQAVSSLAPDSPISDISDMTAGRLKTLVGEQLAGWGG
ncbi:MAG: CheR family methyltransferase [Aggregatilineales bacterium]